MIDVTRNIMKAQAKEMRQQLANIAREKELLAKLAKRLKFKGESNDIIGGALRQRIDNCNEMTTDGERTIAEYDAAMAYLDHYGFEFDDPRPQPAPGHFTGSTLSFQA